MKVRTAVVSVALAVVLAFVTFVYSGIYNVAATDPSPRALDWLLSTVATHSVQARSGDIQIHSEADEAVHEGAHGYHDMCETCHGGPGVSPSEIGKGLNPAPPDLQKSAAVRTPAEIYWIVRHGIKMTGMPAFGPTHNEDQLQNLVAFVRKLPSMTPPEYQQFIAGPDGHTHQH